MWDTLPLQKWSNKERPSICLEMGDTKDTDQISAAQYPFLRCLHLYRWRNCSWWSCVSWARYAKVPRAFMDLNVPCCWTISVLHGSIFHGMQAGRQANFFAKLYQIRLCQPRKCLQLLQKLQAICLMILQYIHAISINPGLSWNQNLYQIKCFINSIISWFDDGVRNYTRLADDPNVCKQVTNSSCGHIQSVEIVDGLLITLYYGIWCIILLTLENFRWVPKKASEEFQRESMEIWRSWILYLCESTLSESIPESTHFVRWMVFGQELCFHPSLR